MKVQLPWPPKALQPNARAHWSKKARATRDYRQSCHWECRALGLSAAWDGPIHVTLCYVPPDRRRRDMDNLIAASKALLDGIADALGVDDHRFVIHASISDLTAKGGFVSVTITAGPTP